MADKKPSKKTPKKPLNWQESLGRIMHDGFEDGFLQSQMRWILGVALLLVIGGTVFYIANEINSTGEMSLDTEAEPEEPAPEINLAKLQEATGGVEFRRDDGKWMVALGGMTLQAGDRIRTGPEGEAIVTFPGNSEMRVGRDTEVEIQVLLSLASDEGRLTRIQLNQATGRLYHRVINEDNRFKYTVILPHLTAESVGTAFVTDLVDGAQDASRVLALQHRVKITREAGELTLSQGQTLTVGPGVAAAEPTRIASETLRDPWIERNKTRDLDAGYPLGILVDFEAPPLRTDSVKSGDIIETSSVEITGATEPGAKVYVNDRAARVNPDGTYTAAVDLEPGSNDVTIRTEDGFGNETVETIQLERRDPPPEAEAPDEPAPAAPSGGSTTPAATPTLYLQDSSQQGREVVFAWTPTAVTADTWHLVFGRQSQPVFPNIEDESWVGIVGGSERTLKVAVPDDGIWFFRLCAYRAGQCALYSNERRLELKAPVNTGTVDGYAQTLVVSAQEKSNKTDIGVSWEPSGNTSGLYAVAWSRQSDPAPNSCVSGSYTGLESSVSGNGYNFRKANFDKGTWYFGVSMLVDGRCAAYGVTSIEIK